MALSSPRVVYGVHSVAPYNKQTGEFYGIAKVVDSSSISISSELISLTGGSQKFPWAVESGPSTAELSLSVGQYDDFLLELAYGKAPTANAAEASGSVTALENKTGTLVVTTGLASVDLTALATADLKFGKYVVKAVDATTVDVYVSSDIAFSNGVAGEYENDLLKITATPLTIVTDTAVEVPNFGISFTGGSGTIAMVAGETAIFSVRPASSKSMDIVIGGASDIVPEIGMIIYSAQRGTNELFEIDLYSVKLSSMPFSFAKNEFSVAEIAGQAYYDSSRNGVLSIRSITPV